ncbi:hypothetical protein POPTR_010G071850v4 [Populus trichocarpa]|uniref:Uncharacterized protein n=1 Tax=Populus trichocarpa TaxID=3694 RepID=A0ACC0SC71_POPTR|nr:hypothetical protein POPTR_010G071850v4 [Populus trichocarpa]
MTMDENPQCSFQILRPAAKKPKFCVGSTVTAKSGTIPHKIKSREGQKDAVKRFRKLIFRLMLSSALLDVHVCALC